MTLPVAVKAVFVAAERKFGATQEEIVSESQFRPHVRARAYIAQRLREQGYSLRHIGRYLGWRSHATVCNYLRVVEKEMPPFDPAHLGPSEEWA